MNAKFSFHNGWVNTRFVKALEHAQGQIKTINYLGGVWWYPKIAWNCECVTTFRWEPRAIDFAVHDCLRESEIREREITANCIAIGYTNALIFERKLFRLDDDPSDTETRIPTNAMCTWRNCRSCDWFHKRTVPLWQIVHSRVITTSIL